VLRQKAEEGEVCCWVFVVYCFAVLVSAESRGRIQRWCTGGYAKVRLTHRISSTKGGAAHAVSTLTLNGGLAAEAGTSAASRPAATAAVHFMVAGCRSYSLRDVTAEVEMSIHDVSSQVLLFVGWQHY
jgi:hypothetical protein